MKMEDNGSIRKRRVYTVAEKLPVLDRVHSGEKQASISKDIGINESTLRGWLKDERKYRNFVSDVDSGERRKRIRYAHNLERDLCSKTMKTQKLKVESQRRERLAMQYFGVCNRAQSARNSRIRFFTECESQNHERLSKRNGFASSEIANSFYAEAPFGCGKCLKTFKTKEETIEHHGCCSFIQGQGETFSRVAKSEIELIDDTKDEIILSTDTEDVFQSSVDGWPSSVPVIEGCGQSKPKLRKKPKRPCLFCGKLRTHLSRHILEKHKNLPDVKRLRSLPREDRMIAITMLRKSGILKYNKSQMSKKDPEYQCQKKSTKLAEKLVVCEHCSGTYFSGTFHVHKSKCVEDPGLKLKPLRFSVLNENSQVNFLSEEEEALSERGFPLDRNFSDQILDRLKADNCGKVACGDPMIVRVGLQYFRERPDAFDFVVMQMQRLGALLVQFRSAANNSKLTFVDVLDRSNFPKLVEAIDEMCQKENVVVKSQFKISLGRLIKKSANVMEGHYLINREDKKHAELQKFVTVLKHQWNGLFGKGLQKVNEEQMETVSTSVEKDHKSLVEYCIKTMNKMVTGSGSAGVFGKQEFEKLRAAVVSRLVVLNLGKGCDPACLEIRTWRESAAANWVEYVEKTSDEENETTVMCKLVYQLEDGMNDGGPILIPHDTCEAIKKLVAVRKRLGIEQDNRYVFACADGSRHHVVGWHDLRRTCDDAGVPNVSLISACQVATNQSDEDPMQLVAENAFTDADSDESQDFSMDSSLNIDKIFGLFDDVGQDQFTGTPFEADVLLSIRDDDVGLVCKTDVLIMLVGEKKYEKNAANPERKDVKSGINQEMRRLAKLYMHFKKELEKSDLEFDALCNNASDMFDADKADILREALVAFISSNDQIKSITKAELKNQMYCLLHRTAKVASDMFLEIGDQAKSRRVATFSRLLKDLKYSWFGDAQEALTERRQEHQRIPEPKPNEVEIKTVHEYIGQKIVGILDSNIFWTPKTYIELRDLVVSQLHLYNARRGGEPSRLLKIQWIEATNFEWRRKDPSDDAEQIERDCHEGMKTVYQRSKSGQYIPVIFLPFVVEAVNKLCDKELRVKAGVNPINPHLFPATANSMLPIDGWLTLNDTIKAAGIPENRCALFTAPDVKHTVSIEFAKLDLPPNIRELFYKPKEHSAGMNTDIYQDPPEQTTMEYIEPFPPDPIQSTSISADIGSHGCLNGDSSKAKQQQRKMPEKPEDASSVIPRVDSLLRRKSYTIDFKVAAIKFAMKTRNKAQAAKEFNCNESSIREWLKEKDELQKIAKLDARNRWRIRRGGKWPQLDASVLEWFESQRKDDRIVSRKAIQNQAIVLAREMNINNFTGSVGWVSKFMRRNFLAVEGEEEEEEQEEEEEEEDNNTLSDLEFV